MAPDTIRDVFLQPGEYHFGAAPERIRTLLGSCVAITMWHPLRGMGGMVHCLLPSRGAPDGAMGFNGRFVDEGLRWLLRESVRACVDPAQCEYKIFGGANMFAAFGIAAGRRTPIGEVNAGKALAMLDGLDLHVRVRDIGGLVHRALVFDLSTGDVWVRYGDAAVCGPGMESSCA